MISSATSRLDRLLARLAAQKAWLEDAAARVSGLPGPILEVGLGKGRTYDHLRRLMPGRRILAFDLDLHAPSDARPADADLLLGDFRVTLPRARAEIGDHRAVLIHADFGSEDATLDAQTSEWLGALLAPLNSAGWGSALRSAASARWLAPVIAAAPTRLALLWPVGERPSL